VDFNVPLTKDLKIRDTNRIDESLPTLYHILSQSPRSLVIMSHLGRPDGQVISKYSMKPLIPYLEEKLKRKVEFLEDCVGEEAEKRTKEPSAGSIFLLENLRFHVEEEGKGKSADGKKLKASKESVQSFRSSLSRHGDIYINDAFGTAHRAHSSVVGISLPIRASGFLMEKELQAFAKLLEEPKKPYIAILGGAKVQDKIQLIENLLNSVDELIIGGAMAFTFIKVLYNYNIGKSLYDEKGAEIIPTLMSKAKAKNVKVHLPHDFKIASSFSNDAKTSIVTLNTPGGIPDGWLGLDIGPASSLAFASVIWGAKSVILNGPMGVFEFNNFNQGTISILQAMAAVTKLNHTITVVGGGDSASAAKDFGVNHLVTHVSTGGGASLELLEGKKLPGIVALSEKNEKLKSKL